MARNHYDVLGIKPTSTPDEIKSAYRRLVLKYHPDRSSDPKAAEIFMAITESYNVLSDPETRKEYDRLLMVERLRATHPTPPKVQTAKPPQPEPTRSRASSRNVALTAELTRLSLLFSRGQFGEAERLAIRIRQQDSRQPLPYAVLSEIARNRGDLKEAERLMALAVQMDPRNETYRLRYEEMVRGRKPESEGHTVTQAKSIEAVALLAGAAMVVLASIYLALSKEMAILPSLSLISSWTLGFVAMALICGVTVGAALSIGGHLDRFSAMLVSSLGRVSPVIALATVAIVNFWLATGLYVAMSLIQKSFNFSLSRVIGATAGTVVLLSAGSALSPSVEGWQAFLWGGNLVYIGALSGWMTTDALRR